MKNRKAVLIMSLVTLAMSYFIIRYSLFEMHKMINWTNIMLGVAIVALGIATYFNLQKTMMLSTLALIISFMIGMTFKWETTNAHGAVTNNAWLIWLGSYLIMVVIGVFLDKRSKS